MKILYHGVVRSQEYVHPRFLFQLFFNSTCSKLRLDGTIEVTHPNSDICIYPLQRLTKLYDGIEQLEDDGWAEGMSEGYESNDDTGDGVWLKDDTGVWRYHLHEDDDGEDWEETDEEYVEGENGHDDDDVMSVDEDHTDEMDTALPSLPGTLHPDMPPPERLPPAPAAPHHSSSELHQDIMVDGDSDSDELDSAPDDSPWKRFDILTAAPSDHAFYSSIPAQPSKQFLGRLAKEYRVLSNSLPGVFIVL